MIERIIKMCNITSVTDKENITNLLTEKQIDLNKLIQMLEVIEKIKLDDSSFMSAILDFVFAIPTETDFEYVKQKYSQDVYDLFYSLKQLEKYQTDNLNQAENFRMMLVAISKDIRVIIIKLCSILFTLRNYVQPITEVQKHYLLQIREIFAPLAERLGLNFMKSELEDICLKFLEPEIFDFLQSSVMLKKDENDRQIQLTKDNLEKILKDLKINGVITYRQKHFSSIHKKMKAGNIPLAKIYDLIAMRVIVNTVEECYAVVGGIHGIYKPMPDRIKDYIANPKPNGYMSLHTTIIAENERPMEIQIRTHDMHKVSEFGIAAHWIYKEKRVKKSTLDEKLGWIRSIMETESLTSRELIDTFKKQLNTGVIYVQTPKGKILEFPEDATLIDFAYAIHSDIGNYCVGGKINGKIKPLTTKMNNGDVVEIITSPNSKGPSRDWLSVVETAQAKGKIKYFFRKEYKEEHIRNGHRIVEEEFKSRSLDSGKYLANKYFDSVCEKMCFNNPDELFASVGYGSVSVKQVVNRLIAEEQRQNQNLTNNSFTPKISIKKNKDGILIDGDSGMLIRFANCCSPVMGDPIVGYISRGKGVTIHRANCHNVQYLEDERLISADWNDKKGVQAFETSLKVTSQQSNSYVQQIVKQIMENKVYILSFTSRVNNQNKMVTILKLQVESNEQLNKVIKLIEKFDQTYQVERANE